MPRHIDRWNKIHDIQSWNSEVSKIKEFFKKRYNVINVRLMEQAHLGPSQFTLNLQIQPLNSGSIDIVNINVKESPWSSTYYENLAVPLKAIANTGLQFDHWEGDLIGTNPELSITMDGNKNVIAVFGTPKSFMRGDANNDGGIDISDPVAILGFLFMGKPATLSCFDAADANDSGTIDITDGIHLLNFLFNPNPTDGTDKILAPYPDKGPDPTADGLGCNL